MMLPADYVLTQDKSFKKYVKQYADDQDLFFNEYVLLLRVRSFYLQLLSQLLEGLFKTARAWCAREPVGDRGAMGSEELGRVKIHFVWSQFSSSSVSWFGLLDALRN